MPGLQGGDRQRWWPWLEVAPENMPEMIARNRDYRVHVLLLGNRDIWGISAGPQRVLFTSRPVFPLVTSPTIHHFFARARLYLVAMRPRRAPTVRCGSDRMVILSHSHELTFVVSAPPLEITQPVGCIYHTAWICSSLSQRVPFAIIHELRCQPRRV